MHKPTQSPTAYTPQAPFISTQCTYWVLIKSDQRALITCISEWRLHWVGTKHTNKTVCKVTGFSVCVCVCVCVFVSTVCGWVCVWVVCVNCSVHWSLCVHVMQLPLVLWNSISHSPPAVQQRMMDVTGSETNYPLYTDERGWPSSPCAPISYPLSPTLSRFVIKFSLLFQYVYPLGRKEA